MKRIVGVDEAGRGPLAGPVSVGVVSVPYDFDWTRIPNVTDSKKLSEKKREEIFAIAQRLKKEGAIDYQVSLVHAHTIDTKGISCCVRIGIERGFKKLSLDPNHTDVRLDGLLRAPDEFVVQETIVKGDAKEKVIGLASILAKVTRDRYIVRTAKKYPQYDFHIHKGYGTKAHREAIQKYGLSDMHRASFCTRLTR